MISKPEQDITSNYHKKIRPIALMNIDAKILVNISKQNFTTHERNFTTDQRGRKIGLKFKNHLM